MTLGCQHSGYLLFFKSKNKKTETSMCPSSFNEGLKKKNPLCNPYSKATKLLTLNRLGPTVPKGKARISVWMQLTQVLH